MEIKARKLYAHTPIADGDWHLLEQHLKSVAEQTEEFTSKFGANHLGYIIGLLHDAGKASDLFQDYLISAHNAAIQGSKAPPRSVDHKLAGVKLASEIWQPIGFCLLGHHGGLPDLTSIKARLEQSANRDDVAQAIERFKTICPNLDKQSISVPKHVENPLTCEFLIRMLFSALVDADYLDTECHWDKQSFSIRQSSYDLQNLWNIFDREQTRMMKESPETPINSIRQEIYKACLDAAERQRGVYKLAVPTGGGKTRSGMAFALKHAMHNKMERIIVAIPYTSIIDQNAQVYRSIFGEANVLEHHSAVEFKDTEEYSEADLKMRLATENWDAPIIVTTTVQLFESLFARKPSRCRKLHNIANSVLILDEVQTLPTELLEAIIDVLKELVANYGVTVVLSTATQPAFSGNSPYLSGFTPEPLDIVPNPAHYFDALKRVEYEIDHEPCSWEKVSELIQQTDQVLCIVNSRKDAITLFDMVNDPQALHLSTLMCPAHRKQVLSEIKNRLDAGKPCKLISTQVVEAGVDLDFPVVFRAVAPLDRIVQAAGRCNREGRLSLGKVVVFQPKDEHKPLGTYRTAMAEARRILHTQNPNLHDPVIFEHYFQSLWQNCNLDAYDIQQLRKRLDYPEVDERFRMIRNATVPVVVRYGEPGPDELIAKLRAGNHASKDDWRKIQQYTVGIYQHELRQFLTEGLVEPIIEGLYKWVGSYDELRGISCDFTDPADLIARKEEMLWVSRRRCR